MFPSLTITVKPVLDRIGDDHVDDRDAASVLAAIEDSQTVRNLAEAHEAQLVVRYCRLNTTLDSEPGPVIPGSKRLVRPGGDGTPAIAEFAIDAIAVRRRISHDAARAYVADVLDLRYRFPRLWQRLADGDVELWRARQIADTGRVLGADAAGVVDRQVVGIADTVNQARLGRIVEAAMIAADPEGAEQRAGQAAGQRRVEVSRWSAEGLKTMFIRADAPDVIRFDGAVDFIADLLKLDGDRDPKQTRRAKAIGVIANPNAVLDLFTRTRGATAGPVVPDELDYQYDETGQETRPLVSRETRPDEQADQAATGDGCDRCRNQSPWTRPTPHGQDRLFPTTNLYLHLNEDTFRGTVDDPARLEQAGPLTAGQARDLLGHSRVILTPVIDLPGIAPVDAYEIRGRMREAVFLKSAGASCFPYSDTLGRHQQVDHSTAHPDGDSSLPNLGLLPTPEHRAKTHGDWDLRQPFPGIYVWKDPVGQIYIVDHRGTRPLR